MGFTWSAIRSTKPPSATALLAVVALAACGENAGTPDEPESVLIGAALPFTGQGATIGRNLEQALQLAVEDVNRAGGIEGRPLVLRLDDSNSGTPQGLGGLLDLLYVQGVNYLVGPEEIALADEIIPDIKGLDVFNVLPGIASPGIERQPRTGAWLRLPPTPLALGCGLSELALSRSYQSTSSITTRNDFNQSVASEFATEYFNNGGTVMSTVTVAPGTGSYASLATAALREGADGVLLVADPATASTIVTEWAVARQQENWLLGPALQTPGFLLNVPPGSLNGAFGVSPTLSLEGECEQDDSSRRGPISCRQDNADRFREHFAQRWLGDHPFPAAHFYYDAVVLVAMGLQYASAHGDANPSASTLHTHVLEMTNGADQEGRWDDLDAVFSKLATGTPVTYVGAAAEYEFDRFGAATHLLFDVWRVAGRSYAAEGTLQTQCTAHERWIGPTGATSPNDGAS